MATRLSGVSVAVEVLEIVLIPLMVLVPVPETVVAVRLITLWSLWNGAGRGVPRGAAAWW